METIPEKLMQWVDKGSPWITNDQFRLLKQAAYRIRDLECRLRIAESYKGQNNDK